MTLLLGGCQYSSYIEIYEEKFFNDSTPTRSLPSPVPEIANNPSLNNLEQSIHQQINEYRQSQNLPPLSLNSTISQQARLHSQAMAEGNIPFSHEGFDGRIAEISQTIPYSSVAENVATNQGYANPARQAVSGWLDSPGHYKNIVGNYDLTGIGVVENEVGEYYFTQIFLKSR